MRNIDYINKKIAEETKLPLNTVSKINNYYWSSIKKEMRKLDNLALYIKEIGTFEVSNFKLKKHIKYLRDYIKGLRNSNKYTDSRKEKIIIDYKDSFARCIKIQKQSDEHLNYLKNYKKQNNTDGK